MVLQSLGSYLLSQRDNFDEPQFSLGTAVSEKGFFMQKEKKILRWVYKAV